MIDWTERQVSSTLAVIRKSFKSDRDFYEWMQNVTEQGLAKMSTIQIQIAEQNSGSMVFNSMCDRLKGENDFLVAMYAKS